MQGSPITSEEMMLDYNTFVTFGPSFSARISFLWNEAGITLEG